jgi:hypothetical protein
VVLFTLINLAGAVFAAVRREWLHAAVHVGLLLVGAGVMWRFAQRVRGQNLPRVPRADERLDHLRQSVDAIALEVERIDEAQRFSAKLQAERVEPFRPN